MISEAAMKTSLSFVALAHSPPSSSTKCSREDWQVLDKNQNTGIFFSPALRKGPPPTTGSRTPTTGGLVNCRGHEHHRRSWAALSTSANRYSSRPLILQ